MNFSRLISDLIRFLAGLAPAPSLQPIPVKAERPKNNLAAPRGKMEKK
ncbi:hypothetical protein Q9295_04035 [Xinfangfangia sp. CPCC 101601]|uniref:Uncharacterized protein n=1 Tax=Pseudogemmobacter lacusdianii TaxID=3069608 RepID=A0ABU0VWF9_9RHOB|nr:hypothetical protein [Xinfangfangia sp. CPCC 101601]MDQ2065530.1 hypothetical protein [Xinfangfangia sp. CPCC 101601]